MYVMFIGSNGIYHGFILMKKRIIYIHLNYLLSEELIKNMLDSNLFIQFNSAHTIFKRKNIFIHFRFLMRNKRMTTISYYTTANIEQCFTVYMCVCFIVSYICFESFLKLKHIIECDDFLMISPISVRC